MNNLPPLETGVYRHFRGPLYLVMMYASDSNAEELYASNTMGDLPAFPDGRTVVVYAGLQLNDASTGPRTHVRTAEDFFAWIHLDGTECLTHAGDANQFCVCEGRDGHAVKRFDYLGPQLTTEMMQ